MHAYLLCMCAGMPCSLCFTYIAEPVIRGGVLPDQTPGQKGVAVGGPTRVISSGTNVNIRCELVSATMPESAISWVKVSGGVREPISDDGSKFIITSNDRESELVISAFDNNDVGTYHCIAANSVGSDTALVRLDLCPPESRACPANETNAFNLPVEFTEGLNDTCVYCATWQMTGYGPVSWLVTTSGVVFKESEVTLVMNVPVATSVPIPQSFILNVLK